MKDIFQIIDTIQLSEKATLLSEINNEYVFKVDPRANKLEIKEAVEKIYEVPVKKVSVLNVKGKVKRSWRGTSRRPNWKKAYVSLEAGHDIDFS